MNDNSRTVNSVKNITTGFAGQLIQMILGFVSRTIFINFLATEYLGISGLFSNVLSVLSLAELGIGNAIIYSLYKPLAEKDEDKIGALMSFYSKAYKIIGIFIILIGIILTPFLKFIISDAPNIKENLYVIFLFYLFNTAITYFFSYRSSIIIADQKNYISGIISYIVSFIQTLLQILILVLTKNFLLYLFVQSICILSYNLLISKMSYKMYPFLKEKQKNKLDMQSKKELKKNIKALMVVKLSGVLVNNTDNFIITYFSGLSMVGLCSNYNMLIGIINGVLIQIFNGITASVGNLNAKESVEKKINIFNIINFLNFWFFGFSAICIVVLLNDVIKVWLGTNYVLPLNIPIILAVNFYMIGMQNAVWTYKNTMGLFVKGKYILIITAIINLCLSIILGKYLGLFGILLATAIARLFTNVWYDPFVVCKYGLEMNPIYYFKKYFKYLLIIILSIIITFSLCELVKINSILGLFIKLIICLIIPNLINVLVFFKTKEFEYLLNMMKNITKIKLKINLDRGKSKSNKVYKSL